MKFHSWLPLLLATPLSLIAQVTAPPNPVTVTVQAGTTVRTLDPRFYGVNLSASDAGLTGSVVPALTQAVHFESMRFPGGGWADDYDWVKSKQISISAALPNSIGTFAQFVQAQGATGFVQVNYGSATPQSGAALVAYLNAATTNGTVIGVDAKSFDWKTAGFWASLRAAAPLATDDGYNVLRINHAAPFGFKYFEIGNETYVTDEYDLHGVNGSGLTGAEHDPFTYAQSFPVFKAKMLAIDSTIHFGVPIVANEDVAGIGQNPVINPRTGKSHTGWDAVLLGNLKSENSIPDFLSFHYYVQTAGQESDNALLQSQTNVSAAASVLRQELNDYLSTSASAVELNMTELNSVYSHPGKQTANLVNGLFYADTYGSLAQTEFNAALWWDLQHGEGAEISNNNASSLYGWRDFGSYNMIGDVAFANAFPDSTPLPAYYAAKLMTEWARGGDTIVSTTSNYAWLSAYAAKLADGSLALLVVNKNPTTDVTAQIALNGYSSPSSTATVYSFGKVNDGGPSTPATNITSAAISNASSNFSYTFPSYSMSVIRLSSSTPSVSKLVNLSTRSQAQTGNNVQIAGFVITGSAKKTVLIRANGPVLTKYSVTGALADPTLELHSTTGIIATNDNWGDDPTQKAQILAAATAVGAGAWDDGSKDAAILTSLDPGAYTAIVTGKNGTQGVALIEVFEVDTTNTASRLVNISTRSYVGTGNDVQIAGFVISPGSPKKVVIRANGPALAQALPGAFLVDPVLTLNSITSGTVVATNDNWDSALAADFAAVGAPAWTGGSKDAAIVMTLAPGVYTATVSGAANTTGIALVEVFEEQ